MSDIQNAAPPQHATSAYDGLPAVVRANVTRAEYDWMSNEQRATLLDELCNPEPEGD